MHYDAPTYHDFILLQYTPDFTIAEVQSLSSENGVIVRLDYHAELFQELAAGAEERVTESGWIKLTGETEEGAPWRVDMRVPS